MSVIQSPEMSLGFLSVAFQTMEQIKHLKIRTVYLFITKKTKAQKLHVSVLMFNIQYLLVLDEGFFCWTPLTERYCVVKSVQRSAVPYEVCCIVDSDIVYRNMDEKQIKEIICHLQ